MKSAIFALLFSSVVAIPKQGTPEWDKTLKMHREGAAMLEKKGFNFNVKLEPQGCTKSHQCGFVYRMGGCCFRVRVTKNSDGKVEDYQNAILKMQGETGGLCYLGSGVDVIEANGGKTDSYTYSKAMWDNDPQIRATWGAYMGEEQGENPSFDDFNAWLKKAMPDQIARKDQFVEGQCIDDKLHPLDTTWNCNKTSDCADTRGNFNGGCCARIEVSKGKTDKETDKFLEEQGKEGGYCMPKWQADYFEGKDEVNQMKNMKFGFENDYVTNSQWTWRYPEEMQKEITWDTVLADVRKQYPAIDEMRDTWFTGKCMGDGSRLPGEPMDWEAVMKKYFEEDEDRRMGPITVDMEDGKARVQGPGFEITMTEGEDGNMMRIVMDSATKLAASAIALASLTQF